MLPLAAVIHGQTIDLGTFELGDPKLPRYQKVRGAYPTWLGKLKNITAL
jgi:hypothetical protein